MNGITMYTTISINLWVALNKSSSESDTFSGSLSNSDSPMAMLKSHCQSKSELSSCSGRFGAADHLLRNSRWRRENKECLYYRFFDSNLRKQAMFGTMYYWSYWSSKISDVLLEFQLEHNKHRLGSLVPCVYKIFPVTRRKVAGGKSSSSRRNSGGRRLILKPLHLYGRHV
jgi:hypothetical protein